MRERQLTFAAYGHVLTNIGCWSHDGRWIVYDTRSDAAGQQFDGRWIERVEVSSGRVERLFESVDCAHCGVVTCCPVSDRVVFILGPANPTADWSYAAFHRRGVVLDTATGRSTALEAANYAEPFVPGALRGGTHVHTFDARGQMVAFTYEDHVLATSNAGEPNQRNIGVCLPRVAVEVEPSHPRNHAGSHFAVLLSRTWSSPTPGSDQIDRAYEDAWIGKRGYRQPGSNAYQPAIAFLGDVVTSRGNRATELFVIDLPVDFTVASDDGPLAGTTGLRPRPPRGTCQRRLTFAAESSEANGGERVGVSGPRHWPRSSPDGSAIFFLMRDVHGSVQLWSVSPTGGQPAQLSRLTGDGVSSAFSVSPDGLWIAHTAENCVCMTSVATGETRRVTEPQFHNFAPRPEACVFSPSGDQITYVRRVSHGATSWNQIYVVDL